MPGSEPNPRDERPEASERPAGGNPLAALLVGLWRVLVVGVLGALVEAFRRVFGLEPAETQSRRQDDDGRSRDGGGGSDESR